MKYVLAIDQGTTSTRAIVFDEKLTIVAQAQEEFPQIFPQSGWIEHDPNDLWGTTAGTCREVIERANSLPFGLAAYGFSTNPKTVAALKSEIETGMLAINSMHVHSVETPFGGVKHSGYGSEGGTEGLDAFLTVKYSSEIY